MTDFETRNADMIQAMASDAGLRELTRAWFIAASRYEYSYHFSWLGRPVIQFPQDLLALQEVVWNVQPDLIIEAGIAHGGSLIFYAFLLELIGNNGEVVGIDIDIREHNKAAICEHPLHKRIVMIQGSSTDELVVDQVRHIVRSKDKRRVMVVLDSNHTRDHVLSELRLYSPLVSKGSYLVVMDTIIEDMPEDFSQDRPWGRGDNPKTAVAEFMRENERFEVDWVITNKLLITVAPGGYLKCIKD